VSAGLPGPWTDSHCHVHDENDAEDLVRRAAEAGVGAVVLVGTGVGSSRRALALASSVPGPSESRPALYFTAGLHPHEASHGVTEVAALLEELAAEHRPDGAAPGELVGVGECGLDYFYEHSPKPEQRVAFVEQIALAKRLDLALVVHTRDAWDDTFSILESEGLPERTVIHCFSGGPQEASRLVGLGAYLSFSGIATFKSADEVREAAAVCPADRLLVETDAPYLAPVPHRGRPNEPALVTVVGEAIAAVREVDPALLATETTGNARRVFRLAG